MKASTLVALILIVIGLEGLFYGGFSYVVDNRRATNAPVSLSAKQKQSVMIPFWGGVGAIAVGGLILLVCSRKREKKS